MTTSRAAKYFSTEADAPAVRAWKKGCGGETCGKVAPPPARTEKGITRAGNVKKSITCINNNAGLDAQAKT